jgi:hypothetical protein
MLRSNGISYDINWAADLIPPIIEYLLFEAQPEVKIPIGAIEKAAIITIKPAGAEEAANLSDNGNKAKRKTDEEMNIMGPIVNRNLSALVGIINSLVIAFIPSATFCRIPMPL